MSKSWKRRTNPIAEDLRTNPLYRQRIEKTKKVRLNEQRKKEADKEIRETKNRFS